MVDGRGDPRPPIDVVKGTIDQNPAGLSLLALLLEDWRTHDRDLLSQGLWAVAVHRFGNWRLRFRTRAVRRPLGLLYFAMFQAVEWVCGITLYDWIKVGRRVRIRDHGGIILGGEIGDDVEIGPRVTLGTPRTGDGRWKTPFIGDRVLIGAGAVVLGPIRIGADSVVAPNSVVLKDVPAGHIAMGVPARARPREDSAAPQKAARQVEQVAHGGRGQGLRDQGVDGHAGGDVEGEP
jgi:serine O-acetyltransferase